MADYFVCAGSGTPNTGTYRGIYANSTAYAVGDKVSPTQAYATAAARGYVYECTTGGTTGGSEPTWVYTTPDTSTTTSNTAVFTCRNPDTWAKAGVYLDQGLQRATTSGDRVIIQYDGVPSVDAEVAADITYNIGADNVSIIASTNSGTATVTPTEMGTSNWIGHSTSNRSVTITGAYSAYIYGITLRNAGSTSDNFTLGAISRAAYTFNSCYFWLGDTATTSAISFGVTAAGSETFHNVINCTFRFGNTSQQYLKVNCSINFIGGSISSAGSTPTRLFDMAQGSIVNITGMDLSLITGTLVPSLVGGTCIFRFQQCKFGAGVTVLAAQTTNDTGAGGEVYVMDCASGDQHYHFQHYNALGTLTTDASVYASDGAAYDTVPNRASWKIVTTANASYANPYISPWVTVHHEGTAAITPYFEVVRSGSATAYQNDEIWSEWLFKGTSGFTTGTFDQTDRRTLGGTAADQTSSSLGSGDWTGEHATSWFGKLSPTATITPAEIGDLCGRIVVAEPSITVFIDPQIRGRS